MELIRRLRLPRGRGKPDMAAVTYGSYITIQQALHVVMSIALIAHKNKACRRCLILCVITLMSWEETLWQASESFGVNLMMRI